MKEYNIPVSWEMYGIMRIKANSLEEAIEKAMSSYEQLPRGEYVCDSLQVDYDFLEEEFVVAVKKTKQLD